MLCFERMVLYTRNASAGNHGFLILLFGMAEFSLLHNFTHGAPLLLLDGASMPFDHFTLLSLRIGATLSLVLFRYIQPYHFDLVAIIWKFYDEWNCSGKFVPNYFTSIVMKDQ